jgi:hypothetical protein
MDHFAGPDVSVKATSVCIVDDTGKVVREVKVTSEPEALLAVLKNPAYHFKRIGLEAGPLSQWLFSALAEAELPVVCDIATMRVASTAMCRCPGMASMRISCRFPSRSSTNFVSHYRARGNAADNMDVVLHRLDCFCWARERADARNSAPLSLGLGDA